MFEEKTREEILKDLIMSKDITRHRPDHNTTTVEQTNTMIKNAEENLKAIENLNDMLTDAYNAEIKIKIEPDETRDDISITYNNKTLTVKFGYRLHEMISEATCDISSISSAMSAAMITATHDLEKAQEYAKWLQETPLEKNALSKRQLNALKILLKDNEDEIEIVNNFFREYKKHKRDHLTSIEIAMETIPRDINYDDMMLGYAIKAMIEIDNEENERGPVKLACQ